MNLRILWETAVTRRRCCRMQDAQITRVCLKSVVVVDWICFARSTILVPFQNRDVNKNITK